MRGGSLAQRAAAYVLLGCGAASGRQGIRLTSGMGSQLFSGLFLQGRPEEFSVGLPDRLPSWRLLSFPSRCYFVADECGGEPFEVCVRSAPP